jgi:hypothetical protein
MAGHCLETTINLLCPTRNGTGHPFDQMVLEDSLVELVQDVRSEAVEDVAEWEVLPERIDGTEAVCRECLRLVIIGGKSENLHRLLGIPKFRLRGIPKASCRYEALGTPILLTTGNQALLRVVGNICSKDRVDAAGPSIGADHEDPRFARFDEGFQK